MWNTFTAVASLEGRRGPLSRGLRHSNSDASRVRTLRLYELETGDSGRFVIEDLENRIKLRYLQQVLDPFG